MGLKPYHEAILQALKEGVTYQSIADKYKCSRERIRQLSKLWGVSTKKIRAQKRALVSLERQEYLRKKFGEKNQTPVDLYREQRAKFHSKRCNARRVGIDWNINFGDIKWPTHCPILGIPLDYFAEGRQENSISFDRYDPSKGYVTGNVQIISWRANRIKNDGTYEEHLKIAEYLRNQKL